ncbi:MAG: UDP-N-acetylmuramoyl-L-alanyl-D-glutamate--2,6-diaminopimelate ligase [Victivallales bacterium]|nr:UDP-N-acetylmuramoyl-L-alanyl-D-glutamate--2,6-diaminopimelate ligase [Victivallales bacterium]
MSAIGIDEILGALGDTLDTCVGSGEGGREFAGLSNDSRELAPGWVFVAVKGSLNDGHDHIPEALAKGAALIVGSLSPEEAGIPAAVTAYIRVKNSHTAYARLAELFCGYPARDLKIVGITGTNGKTTTAYLLRSILGGVSGKCGLISTVEYSCPGMSVPARWTTPDPMEFQRLLCEFRNSGCRLAAMEVSSHALSQNRVGTIVFEAGVFTNLTGDHLDYHKDMESYFSAKSILFTGHLADTSRAVINTDDAYGSRLHSSLDGALSYGKNGSPDAKISSVSASKAGIEVEITFRGLKLVLKSSLHGTFNAYNTAAAFLAASVMGIDNAEIIAGIANLTSVPGRMEGFNHPGCPFAVVDYAHTDDALKNVLQSLREEAPCKKIWVVFGCGGDRDKSKRSRMGAVAAEFAEKIIITDDNPRSEDPEDITAQIIDGIPAKAKVEIIHDRKDAIRHAIVQADENAIVLIAGKGHETYQERRGTRSDFDDRSVVREMMQKKIHGANSL